MQPCQFFRLSAIISPIRLLSTSNRIRAEQLPLNFQYSFFYLIKSYLSFFQPLIMHRVWLYPAETALFPSFWITTKLTFSVRSYVVNRFSHDEHCLRLLMVSKSSLSLVSTTSVCLLPQYGHFIRVKMLTFLSHYI
jgi:hypothetical protein